MKPITSLPWAIANCLSLAVLPLMAEEPAPPPEPPTAAADLAAMNADIQEVQEKVGMAAPMERQLENGVDPIEEARESGFIIEVTLEQVEAAIAAAAATEDPEDDKRAFELKHRGSYRFYAPSVSAPEPSAEDESEPAAETGSEPAPGE